MNGDCRSRMVAQRKRTEQNHLAPGFVPPAFVSEDAYKNGTGASAAAAEWHAETSEARAAVVDESCPLRHDLYRYRLQIFTLDTYPLSVSESLSIFPCILACTF